MGTKGEGQERHRRSMEVDGVIWWRASEGRVGG